jgi:equilibrative nucleoside transporter 1/2/3
MYYLKIIVFSCVEPKYSGIAGMFGAAMLITGICCGILFGMTLPFIVKNVSW